MHHGRASSEDISCGGRGGWGIYITESVTSEYDNWWDGDGMRVDVVDNWIGKYDRPNQKNQIKLNVFLMPPFLSNYSDLTGARLETKCFAMQPIVATRWQWKDSS